MTDPLLEFVSYRDRGVGGGGGGRGARAPNILNIIEI